SDEQEGPEEDTRSVTASSVMSLFHRVQMDPIEREWLRCAALGNATTLFLLLQQDPTLISKKDFVTCNDTGIISLTNRHRSSRLGADMHLSAALSQLEQRIELLWTGHRLARDQQRKGHFSTDCMCVNKAGACPPSEGSVRDGLWGQGGPVYPEYITHVIDSGVVIDSWCVCMRVLQTALHWASKQGRVEMADMMARSGADVNQRAHVSEHLIVSSLTHSEKSLLSINYRSRL
ncbi:hypothetical protein QQF64_023309, partial [Cirrhinus molitorella]